MKTRSAGRPRGVTQVRDEILEAARRQFNSAGYRGATIRSIAADAGVDAAMISYYFGSKHALLGEVLQLRSDPARDLAHVIDGPLEGIPARVLPRMFAAWEEPDERPALLIHIGGDPALGRLLMEFVETELLGPIARRLCAEGFSPREARRRAGAFASQLLGVVFARYVVKVRQVVELSVDELIALIAPSLTAVLCREVAYAEGSYADSEFARGRKPSGD